MASAKTLIKRIGSGIITGASDDDPAAIGTYAQVGARYGYGLLWLSLFTVLPLYAIQEMSGRLGLVTGRGLVGLIRLHVSVRAGTLVTILLLVANTITVGANLGIMAAAARLIVDGPAWAYMVGFAMVITTAQVVITYPQYVKILRWITLSLLSYVAASFFFNHSWSLALGHTILPSIPRTEDAWFMIVAVLGATISPYVSFWQTNEEVEEEVARGKTTLKARTGTSPYALKRLRTNVVSGMIFSNIIMFFVIMTTAGALFARGITSIETADQVVYALEPIAGQYAALLFAVGIVGTGSLAIPIITSSSSYALGELFQWRVGLSRKFHQARRFYFTIIGSVLLGVTVNTLDISPIQFLLVAGVVNGLLAPVVLWHVIRLADAPAVVGERVSSRFVRTTGWATFWVMTLAAVILILQSLN
jgi:Mn2+/Fe2+ NRAMP family transporter